MRKLTDAEIEHFDFTGITPELNISTQRQKQTVSASQRQEKPNYIARPFGKQAGQKRRLRVGVA